MALVEIDWRPTPKTLRTFGLSMIVGFGLIGAAFCFGWPVAQSPPVAYGLWGFGAAAGLLGLSGTKLAYVAYYPWMAVGFVMGNIISRVVLGLFYYTLITGMGLAFRLAGRDKLRMKKRDVDTYWVDLELPRDPDRYERQF